MATVKLEIWYNSGMIINPNFQKTRKEWIPPNEYKKEMKIVNKLQAITDEDIDNYIAKIKKKEKHSKLRILTERP